MKSQKQCLKCIENLTNQTLGLSFSQHPKLTKTEQSDISAAVLSELKQSFSTGKVPAAIFSRINRKIKEMTRIKDPFLLRKKQEIESSKKISSKILESIPYELKKLLLLSAKGNSLDFFKTIEESEKDMLKESDFSINQIDSFEKKLKDSKNLVFFADNSGEVFFDIPLLRYLSKTVDISYIVKSEPVQNDLSIKELKSIQGLDIPAEIILSGNDTVEIDWNTISGKLKGKMNSADIIIAKGMGYYETFSELEQFRDKVFHLLMAKCLPVAQSLKVDLHSYVFTRS